MEMQTCVRHLAATLLLDLQQAAAVDDDDLPGEKVV